MKLHHFIDALKTRRLADDGTWRPVRPQTAENTFLWLRIKAAWRVLVGKADAVDWPEVKP